MLSKLLLPAAMLLSAPLGIISADTKSGSQVSKISGPPSFFLQDPVDGKCLAGKEFKRCAVDTLWYVTGKPGIYQIHHRPVEETDDELCLDRKNCHADTSEVRLSSCNHCGAKQWNILGDSESGYILKEGEGGKQCLNRTPKGVQLVPCDKEEFVPLMLQFVGRDDIESMSSSSARMITAAADGDDKAVKRYLQSGGDDGTPVDVNARDWDQLTALIAASSEGRLSTVKMLIKEKADVDAMDKDNITALMEASISDHRDVAKALIKAGATVDAQSSTGVTALWLAASQGKADLCKILLKEKADPNNARSDGITALMAASAGGHTATVKLLVDSGATVASTDKDGLTAIINAAENGSVSTVDFLIGKGANASHMSETGFTPLIVAAAGGHLDVCKSLITKGKCALNSMHPEGVSALMYAAAYKHLSVAEYLIKEGADVNSLHVNEGSALIEACTAGAYDIAKLLIENGADLHIQDKDGVTTLIAGASKGHLNITELLVEKGVDVNAKATSGGTPLMFAAGGGFAHVAKFLLEKGAEAEAKAVATPEYIEQVAAALAAQEAGEVDLKNNPNQEKVEPHKDGVTALMVAALGGHLEVVQLLVNGTGSGGGGANGYKVDVRAKDEEGWTALQNAVKGNYGDVAAELVKYGADPNDVFTDEDGKRHNLLLDAVLVKNEEFAQLLIEKGADIAEAERMDTKNNATLLIQAAHHGLGNLTKLLLEQPAELVDISKASSEGVTALIGASSEGHEEIVKMVLVKAKGMGADKEKEIVDAADTDGTTALMAAAVRGHKEIVKALVDAGANVNLQNVDGHTALMFAYNGKNQVASLLDKYNDYITTQLEKEAKAKEEAEKEGKEAEAAAGQEEGEESTEVKAIRKNTEVIEEALKVHVDVIDILVKDGKADTTIQDKEGHAAVDFDYVKPPPSAAPTANAGGAGSIGDGDGSIRKEEL